MSMAGWVELDRYVIVTRRFRVEARARRWCAAHRTAFDAHSRVPAWVEATYKRDGLGWTAEQALCVCVPHA
jgi:hypothetical protein